MIICNKECKRIGQGSFAYVYQSIDNPAIVYFLCNSIDKEIYRLLSESNQHMPRMINRGTIEYKSVTWDVYESDYSITVTRKANKDLYNLCNRMQRIFDSCHAYDVTNSEKAYALAERQISALRFAGIPESICYAFDRIATWAGNYDKIFFLECQPRNMGISEDGTLILRDCVFFPYDNK